MKLGHVAGLAGILMFAGCASQEDTVPAVVSETAAETMPGGEFVMELGPKGRIVAVEARIPIEAVPAACLATAEREVPGGRNVYAEKEVVEGMLYYEVVKQQGGTRYEVLMHPDGTLAGREDPLPRSKWPENVIAAAKAAVPPGQVVACERVTGPEAIAGEDYHVKIDVGGEVQRVSVTADGRIIKVVRKMRAEMRIPR